MDICWIFPHHSFVGLSRDTLETMIDHFAGATFGADFDD
jgi:hypothetical protein